MRHFKEMGLVYLPNLQFESGAIFEHVKRKSLRAIGKNQLPPKEQALGVTYHEQIAKGYVPLVEIRWIDPQVGYGVFAKETIAKGSFVAEYTGIVRKRRGRADRSNDYCFEYTIGTWALNPYVIDAQRNGNISRFINHNSDGNLETMSVYAQGVMHIILVAQDSIEIGDQLSYDYGDNFWKKRRHQKFFNS